MEHLESTDDWADRGFGRWDRFTDHEILALWYTITEADRHYEVEELSKQLKATIELRGFHWDGTPPKSGWKR